jgi:hypothetical protein
MFLSYIDIKRDRLYLKHIEGINFCLGCILHGAQLGRNAQHTGITSSYPLLMVLDSESSYHTTKYILPNIMEHDVNAGKSVLVKIVS